MDGNDLYVLPNLSARSPIRVTSSGNASLFHGVPDWVYEEEVFSGDSALWWSPDSARVAFLRFDETAVDEFTFPVYNPTEDSYAVVPYPEHVTMKYPKPGYNNPLVSVHVFELARYVEDTAAGDSELVALEQSTLELTWEGRHEVNNSVIAEIAWVGNSTLIVKEVNRAATNGSVVLFSLDAGAVNIGRVVRKLGKDGEQGDDGWIEPVIIRCINRLDVADVGHFDSSCRLFSRFPPVYQRADFLHISISCPIEDTITLHCSAQPHPANLSSSHPVPGKLLIPSLLLTRNEILCEYIDCIVIM